MNVLRFLHKNALTVTAVLVVAAVVLATGNVVLLSDQAQSNCQQIERLKGAISLVVSQSVKTLGEKGTAGYDYYLAHPAELAAAKTAGAAELLVFKPHGC